MDTYNDGMVRLRLTESACEGEWHYNRQKQRSAQFTYCIGEIRCLSVKGITVLAVGQVAARYGRNGTFYS